MNTGHDTIPFLVWCFGVKHSKPNVFIQECTPQFDLSVMRRILGDLYDIEARRICPTMLGAGNMRMRQWCIGWRKGSAVVEGGFSGPLFEQLFFRTSVLKADSYFVAPDSERDQALRDIAARRAASPALSQNRPATLEEVLSPGTMCRLEGYRRLMRSERFQDRQVLAANIGQDPGARPWLHDKLQTLLRHSVVVLLRSAQLRVGERFGKTSLVMTAEEHLFAMGVPLFDDDNTEVVNLIKPALKPLDSDFKKHLAGNGMHIMVAGAVLCFALAAIETRPDKLGSPGALQDEGQPAMKSQRRSSS